MIEYSTVLDACQLKDGRLSYRRGLYGFLCVFIPASALTRTSTSARTPYPAARCFPCVSRPARGGVKRAGPTRANTRCSASTTAIFTSWTLARRGPPARRMNTASGRRTARPADHCDPYGFWHGAAPGPPLHRAGTSTPIPFGDSAWQRRGAPGASDPLNIYEMHLGSWRRKPDGGWYTYEELGRTAGRLPHRERLQRGSSSCRWPNTRPDESWGLPGRPVSFAPTSPLRHGPAGLMGAGGTRCTAAASPVLLDFVAAHFAPRCLRPGPV